MIIILELVLGQVLAIPKLGCDLGVDAIWQANRGVSELGKFTPILIS